MAWPVNVSSTWALSMPVCRHWAMNRGRSAWRSRFIRNSDSGIVTSATSASSGEIRIIMMSTPMSVSTDVSIWLQRLLEALGDVVDVVGDAAQQVAARLAVDVAERQRG